MERSRGQLWWWWRGYCSKTDWMSWGRTLYFLIGTTVNQFSCAFPELATAPDSIPPSLKLDGSLWLLHGIEYDRSNIAWLRLGHERRYEFYLVSIYLFLYFYLCLSISLSPFFSQCSPLECKLYGMRKPWPCGEATRGQERMPTGGLLGKVSSILALGKDDFSLSICEARKLLWPSCYWRTQREGQFAENHRERSWSVEGPAWSPVFSSLNSFTCQSYFELRLSVTCSWKKQPNWFRICSLMAVVNSCPLCAFQGPEPQKVQWVSGGRALPWKSNLKLLGFASIFLEVFIISAGPILSFPLRQPLWDELPLYFRNHSLRLRSGE